MQKSNSKLDQAGNDSINTTIADWGLIHQLAFSSLPVFVGICIVTSELIYLAAYVFLQRSGQDYIYGFYLAFFIPLFIGYFLGKSRIKLTRQLAKSCARLEQLYDTSDQLLTILAHDVRGPIGSLIMLSDMVMDESLSPQEAKKMIKNVNEKSRQTLHVIDNLLSWIASQQEDNHANAERFNMTELVLRELKVQSIGAELKNIQVESRLSASIYAWGDAGMISTIIRNLLNNAVKFTELNGRIMVDIGSDDKLCRLEISNTGNEKLNLNQDLLFDKKNAHSQEKGFGFGLKLSREYAQQNNCDLLLTRNDLGGATAKLTIQSANDLH
jgi:signal transduction histidine kinase